MHNTNNILFPYAVTIVKNRPAVPWVCLRSIISVKLPLSTKLLQFFKEYFEQQHKERARWSEVKWCAAGLGWILPPWFRPLFLGLKKNNTRTMYPSKLANACCSEYKHTHSEKRVAAVYSWTKIQQQYAFCFSFYFRIKHRHRCWCGWMPNTHSYMSNITNKCRQEIDVCMCICVHKSAWGAGK